MSESKSPIILNGRHQGLDYISIHENGWISLRHRNENGKITTYEQRIPHVAKTIMDSGCPEQWLPAIFELPECMHSNFVPASVVMLQRPGLGLKWDFLFPRMPCSRVLSYILLLTFIDAEALCNNGSVIRHINRNPEL